jgi:hypothetical protein
MAAASSLQCTVPAAAPPQQAAPQHSTAAAAADAAVATQTVTAETVTASYACTPRQLHVLDSRAVQRCCCR